MTVLTTLVVEVYITSKLYTHVNMSVRAMMPYPKRSQSHHQDKERHLVQLSPTNIYVRSSQPNLSV